MRGHDAQLLVMADITTPEELAVQDAGDRFAIIDAVASSTDVLITFFFVARAPVA